MVNDRQTLDIKPFSRGHDGPAVEWQVSDAPIPYLQAVTEMESRAARIADGIAPELVWLLEHPPLYTSGTSGKAADLLHARFPLFESGRGGQVTYHGPGQRIAYVMLDLKARRPDVRAYVASLEQWIIRTLAAFNVRG
ncbi:MAG: lipoate-protein ligase, partial [Tardiphaga sp.]|nr:lipoate-protein ligase [Tardiphaga sp.]